MVENRLHSRLSQSFFHESPTPSPLWLGRCLLTPTVEVEVFLDPTSEGLALFLVSMPNLLKTPRFTEYLHRWVFQKILDLKIPSESILHFL